MRHISLAITHFNRYPLLLECLAPIIHDERISEIVISDDASTDTSYEMMQRKFGDNPKVKLFRNAVNLDCYANKAKAVERTTNGWTILFDSDNIMSPAYLDTLYAIPEWKVNTAYCPDFAEPYFDYTIFGGLEVTAANVSGLMGVELPRLSRVPDRRGRLRGMKLELPKIHQRFRTALNTCNFFVHRDEYLSVWDGSVNPHTADTLYQNFNWLRTGKRLVIVKGLRYFHRVHPESHFKLNNKKTGSFAQEVVDKLKGLR